LPSLWRIVADSLVRLSTARPGYAAAAFLLYVVSLFIAGARWRGFLRALGGEVGVMRATLATLGGIAAGNLTPAPGGEACRIALVRLGGRATWQDATIAAIWDRLSELPPILVLSAMSLVAVGHLASSARAGGVAAGVLVVAAVVAFALRRLSRSGFVFAGWRDRLALDRVPLSLFVTGVSYSSALWLQDFLRLTCVTLAFGVDLPPTQIAALCVLAMLGGVVPGIAGLGPVEGGLVAGLTAFGVDLPTAAAVTALERAISYGFSTSAGAVVIAMFGGRSVWSAARGSQAPSSEGDTARS
jgi:uncharacterized membrane protein YbhN (UPF0104 family)